jgi:hypothetical protein
MTPDKVPQNFYLGGGVSETVMSLTAVFILLLAGICILSLARKYVVVPLLLAALLVPRGEVLVVGGFHLNPARILVLMGWIKLAYLKWIRRERLLGTPWNRIDSAVLWSSLLISASFVLLWMQSGALFNQFGILWSTIGMYFLLRSVIVKEEDIQRAVKTLVIVIVVNAIVMVVEQVKFENLLGVLIGGVSSIPALRDGKIRSQGAFAHAILAGSYAATLFPLCLLLWGKHKSKIFAVAGLLACLVAVYTSASSTPTIALFGGMLALALWPIRKKMRVVRWSIAIFLIAAHLLMKAPVWFLIARMDVIGASSGYHRAELVDVFIRHFFDWFLIGTKDASTWGWEMFDLSNQYVSKGESGGLLALVFFILIISRSFGSLGSIIKRARDRQAWPLWILGAALFAHVMAFFGISYWDQTEVAWFALLAMICAATSVAAQRAVTQTQTQVVNAAPLVHHDKEAEPGWDLPAPVHHLLG